MDVMNPVQRRKAMANNRGRTRPERALASGLWQRGLRYFTYDGYKHRYRKELPGQPDLVFLRKRVVVFVDGCFWHGCVKCRKHSGLTDQTWKDKIDANKERDLRVTNKLTTAGWRVFRIPEHDVNTKVALAQTVDLLTPLIRAQRSNVVNHPVRDFVLRDRPTDAGAMTAVSLFSGAGLSDLGYQLAGFQFVVHLERDEQRAAIGIENFPTSRWLTRDVQDSADEIESTYRQSTDRPLDLLVATPPCQGMSSANPSRGKRQTPAAEAQEDKNRLMLELVPVAQRLRPRVIVAENVRQVLTLQVEHQGKRQRLIDHLSGNLPGYELFHRVLNVADYGIPQVRNRALVVAVRSDEPCLRQMPRQDLQPWPSPTHAENPTNGERPWISIRDWLKAMRYEPLDAASKEAARGTHSLHFVPSYGSDRYAQISQIPPYSGRSAYQNDTCPACDHQPVREGAILCPSCGSIMNNRPYVYRNGEPALINGFQSSYRRMAPDRPASTITTNSSHVGSDFKVHPWENRVLSILECADLQTVPRFYDWKEARENRRFYLIRNLVGEALPSYFTYLHGLVLSDLLSDSRREQDGPQPTATGVAAGTSDCRR